jgi:DNA-binding PadR family transcriptional regulator
MNYYNDPLTARKLSNVELMLLQIISQAGEISGYAIGKLAEERQYRVWADIGTTSIYTGLEKLKRKGLVTFRLDVGKRGKGPLPKKFRLTTKGRLTLKKEIERSLSCTRERDRRFDLALAGIPLLPPEKVVTALRKRKKFLGEVAGQIKARFQSIGGEALPINIKAVFKHSLHLIKHESKFMDRLLAELTKTRSTKEG